MQTMEAITGTWISNILVNASMASLKVYFLNPIPVRYERAFRTAAIAAGPQTHPSSNVLRLKNRWYDESDGMLQSMVLINMPLGCPLRVYMHSSEENYNALVAWAEVVGLSITTPYELFAIGQFFPTLNVRVGNEKMIIIETSGFSFAHDMRHACYVRWTNEMREVGYDYCHNLSYGPEWFLFKRRPATPA